MVETTIKTENISYLNNSNNRFNRSNRYNNSKKQHTSQSPRQFIQSCLYCGCSHDHGICPARGKTCLKCNRQNQFANVCRSQKSRNTYNVTNQINNINTSDPPTDEELTTDATHQNSNDTINLLTQQPNLAQADNQYLFMLNFNHINTLLPKIVLIIN